MNLFRESTLHHGRGTEQYMYELCSVPSVAQGESNVRKKVTLYLVCIENAYWHRFNML